MAGAIVPLLIRKSATAIPQPDAGIRLLAERIGTASETYRHDVEAADPGKRQMARTFQPFRERLIVSLPSG
jgi:hypothetical protein